MSNHRDLIKLVINDNQDCKNLVEWIQKNLKSNSSYLLELVVAEREPTFISASGITEFPTVLTDFSSVQTSGLFPCIHKLWEVYSKDERKAVPPL